MEGLWEPAGTKLGQSQQPEHRAGLSSRVLFSDGWGRAHCVPWSHLIMDLMLCMDPGAVPEADWDVLSKASLRGSIPGSRAAASLRYQDKLEEHASFLWLAPSRSAWRPPQKDPLQIKYAVAEIWERTHREKRCVWSVCHPSARGVFAAAGKKSRAAHLMKPWEGKLWRASPFPIILVKYTAWESTQAQRAWS